MTTDEATLSLEAMDYHRAVISLIEELDAIDKYNQRAESCTNTSLQQLFEHNRDEEKEHASMLLEWIRRNDAAFDKELRSWLFTDKPFKHG